MDPKKRPVYGAAAWRARNRPPVPLARPWFHPKVDLFNPETDALKMRKLRNRIQNKVSLAKDWYHVAHVGRSAYLRHIKNKSKRLGKLRKQLDNLAPLPEVYKHLNPFDKFAADVGIDPDDDKMFDTVARIKFQQQSPGKNAVPKLELNPLVAARGSDHGVRHYTVPGGGAMKKKGTKKKGIVKRTRFVDDEDGGAWAEDQDQDEDEDEEDAGDDGDDEQEEGEEEDWVGAEADAGTAAARSPSPGAATRDRVHEAVTEDLRRIVADATSGHPGWARSLETIDVGNYLGRRNVTRFSRENFQHAEAKRVWNGRLTGDGAWTPRAPLPDAPLSGPPSSDGTLPILRAAALIELRATLFLFLLVCYV